MADNPLTGVPSPERAGELGQAEGGAFNLTIALPLPTVTQVPTITNVAPTPGTQIGRSTPLSFTINVGGAVVAVQLSADEPPEVVHDGTAFTPTYSELSSRVASGSAFNYSILRKGGWPSSPTLKVYFP